MLRHEVAAELQMMQRGGVDSDDEGEISDDDDIPTVHA